MEQDDEEAMVKAAAVKAAAEASGYDVMANEVKREMFHDWRREYALIYPNLDDAKIDEMAARMLSAASFNSENAETCNDAS